MRKIYTILLLALIYAFLNVLLYNSHTYNIERQKEHTELMQELQRQREQLQDAELFYKQARELMGKLSITEMEATAYTHTGNQTYTGTWPKVGTVAVDPKVIPLGTRGYIVGYGPVRVEDTGGLIKGDIIDLFMETEAECWRWGRRGVKVIWLE